VLLLETLLDTVAEGLEEPDFDLMALEECVGLAEVVLELLIEDVPVLELVVVFDEVIEAVEVRELNALNERAGEDDELFEIVALFVLVRLFSPLLVINAEAECALLIKAEDEYLEVRVLVFDAIELCVGTIAWPKTDNNILDNKSNLIAFTTNYIK
jgi:hypothetical protein